MRNLGELQLRVILEALSRYLRLSSQEIDALLENPRAEIIFPSDLSVQLEISSPIVEGTHDQRPYLVIGSLDDPLPNLIKIIEPFTKEVLYALDNKQDFEILKHRYGLGGSKVLTLQEVGNYYRLTRERVRQRESRGLRKTQDFLLGQAELSEWRIPQSVNDEAKNLLTILKSGDTLLTEPEIISTVQNHYTQSWRRTT